MWMLYWCVDGKEGGEDEGEALSFLVDLHSYTPGMKILNLFYGYAFYKFTMLPKTVKICNCVTLTMCWLIHCIIYPNTKLLNQNETQLNKTKKIHPIMVNRHINYRSWLHKRSVQAKDVTSHWFSALSSDDIL